MDAAQLFSLAKDSGGWAFAALILGAVVYAIVRGALTQGSLLTRALDANDRLAPALQDLSQTTKGLTDQVVRAQGEAVEDVRELRREIRDLLIEIRAERRRPG